jgi:hypothetical protein
MGLSYNGIRGEEGIQLVVPRGGGPSKTDRLWDKTAGGGDPINYVQFNARKNYNQTIL